VPLNFDGTPSSTLYRYGPYYNALANVNNSFSSGNPTLTSLDALITNRRAVGYLAQFPNNKPNFEVSGYFVPEINFNTANTFYDADSDWYESQPNVDFEISDSAIYHWNTLAINHKYDNSEFMYNYGSATPGDRYLNIYYTAVGDINASYVPEYGGWKSKSKLQLLAEDEMLVNQGDVVKIPVRLESGADLGAVTLDMNYRKDLLQVLELNYNDDFARVDAETGTINVGWYNVDGQYFSNEDVILVITARVLADIPSGTKLFELLPTSELANPQVEVIEGNNLKTVSLLTGAGGVGTLTANNYPNPFNSNTTITYNLPESGKVTVVVYNNVGQAVSTLINDTQSVGVHTVVLNRADLAPGVYQYRITLQGESQEYTVTKRMIVVN
jgi:hypothetical protein